MHVKISSCYMTTTVLKLIDIFSVGCVNKLLGETTGITLVIILFNYGIKPFKLVHFISVRRNFSLLRCLVNCRKD